MTLFCCVPDSERLSAALQILAAVQYFPFLFFQTCIGAINLGKLQQSATNQGSLALYKLPDFLHVWTTCYGQNTPSCKPSLQVVSDFTVQSLLNGSLIRIWFFLALLVFVDA